MAADKPRFGPSDEQIKAWLPRYYAGEAAFKARAVERFVRGGAHGALLSTPIAFGAANEYYDFNLDYYKVVREGRLGMSGAYPAFLADYKDSFTSNSRPYFFFDGAASDKKNNLRNRERNVKTHTFAAATSGFAIVSNYGQSNEPRRLTTDALSATVLPSVVDTINGDKAGQGLFAALIPGAPNGFLVSEAHDFDVLWDGDDIDDQVEKSRLRTTYWPERLGENHPLRDLYEKLYGTGARFWDQGVDLARTKINSGTTLMQANSISKLAKPYDYDFLGNETVVLVGGPFSQADIKLRDGNNIVVASPVMTPALHRTIRSRYRSPVFSSFEIDDFHADTVLYPSPVGQHASNRLTVGSGNNIVYYDSSFSDIRAGRGDNIFLPSFGSFNWAIDWVPAFGTALTTGQEGNPWGSTTNLDASWLIPDESGRPLIAPIPWDTTIYNPRTGRKEDASQAYVVKNNTFAKDPRRSAINNLYTINSYKRDKFQRTYLNSERLSDQSDALALASYNPVHQLGGVSISANGGNNVFYGMDWSFWQHLLPGVGTTTASQQANNDYKRAAQHRWNTVTLAGGAGSNSFHLGNVIDNITNNGLFYNALASYQLSLTHNKVYSREEIRKLGSRFGNAIDSVTGQPLMAAVNLQLQADPGTVALTIQNADPGEKGGTTAAQRAGAWNGAANSVNKLVGNTAKINEDYAKGVLGDQKLAWLSRSKSLARIVGSAVPFFDTAIAITSAVVGLVNLFTSKPAKPPKEEIKTTYLAQALDPAQKAILINDWNPWAKVNVNLPSVDANQWNALTFEVKAPLSESTRNTGKGAYLNVNKSTVDDKGVSSKTDFPLVVLENLDISTSLDNGFGYYAYSFVDPDGSGPLAAGYNPIRSSNLRLFGQLPNPGKLLADDGKTPLNPVLFPHAFRDGSAYVYKSEDGFDMRHDAANYSAFFDSASNFYSRYYFNANSIIESNMPAGWTINENLRQFTSNVSLEFDSRTLGWYWQPVLQLPRLQDGSLDAQRVYNPELQSLDFERSMFWVKDQASGEWNATSYADLSYITAAFRASQKAQTFYLSSLSGEARREIERLEERDRELALLEQWIPDLRNLDQTLVADERSRLYLLSQVQRVRPQTLALDAELHDGVEITFTSVDTADQAIEKRLFVYRDGDQGVKAAPGQQLSAGASSERGTVAGDALKADGFDGRLRGFQGDDELWGGEGFDRLKGGEGADIFVFKSVVGGFEAARQKVDRILDFNPRQGDRIALGRASFDLSSDPGAGFSVVDEFALLTTAAEAAGSTARIVFVQQTSELVFNSNGSAEGFGANGGSFAKLNGVATLTNQDFLIV